MTLSSKTPATDLSLGVFLSRWWHEFFGLDGRIWLTLSTALRHPGEHARAHLARTDEIHVHPFRLYLVVNLAFFLLVPFLNGNGLTIWGFTLDSLSQMPPSSILTVEKALDLWPDGEAAYRAVFNEKVRASQALYLSILIPIAALPLWCLLRRRRPFLAEHLLLATTQLTHFLLTLLLFGLATLILRILVGLGLVHSDLVVAGLILFSGLWLAWLLIGLVQSSRTFYSLTWRVAALLGLFQFAVLMSGLYLYGKMLFWYTTLAMRIQ